MNNVILMGRLVRDPQVNWTQGQEQKCVARYTLAVDRRTKTAEGQQIADFISCVSFGKVAEFIEKYARQGTKLVTEGRIQTGSYTNREGQKVYTTDVVVDSAEFAESKKDNSSEAGSSPTAPADNNGFMSIPEGVDYDLPFN